jgi:hypothetical protein
VYRPAIITFGLFSGPTTPAITSKVVRVLNLPQPRWPDSSGCWRDKTAEVAWFQLNTASQPRARIEGRPIPVDPL